MKTVIKNLTMTLTAVSVLSGCSVLNVGEEPPECGVDAQGVECVSAREVWAATDTYDNLEGLSAEEVRREAHKNDPGYDGNAIGARATVYDNNTGRDTQVNKPIPASERAEAYGRFQEERLHLPSPDPLAVREAPGILRVTIAPYVDTNDRANFPSQVFAEVENRTWTIGINASRNTNRITPTSLRAQSRSASKTGLDTPMDNGGLGVKVRPSTKEFDLEGIVPEGAPKVTLPPQGEPAKQLKYPKEFYK